MYSITKVWRSDSQNEFQNKISHYIVDLVHITWKSTLRKSPFCIPIYIHLQLSIRVLWGLLVLKTSHICLWCTKVRKLMSKIASQQLIIILMHLLWWPLACVLVTFLIRPKSSYTNIWFWVVAISIKLLLLLIAFNLVDDLTSTIT